MSERFKKLKKDMQVKYNFPTYTLEFLRFIDTNRRPGTRYAYSTSLKQFHEFLIEKKIILSELKRPHLVEFMQKLKADGKGPGTRCVRIINLRCYLYWLNEMGYLEQQAGQLIKNTDLPKIPERLPRPLPPEVDTILLERLRAGEDHYCKGLLIQRLTGLRISELLNLEFNCIHRNATGEIFVRVPVGKLNTERVVPITKEIEELILLCQELTKLKIKNKVPPYLIATKNGSHACANTFRRALFDITRDLAHLDTEKYSPHRLRHTYATELISAGMTLSTVMKLLGHKSPGMTLTYAKVTGATIQKEYFEALANIKKNHKVLKNTIHKFKEFSPSKALTDVKLWIIKNITDSSSVSDRRKANLIDKVRRFQKEISKLEG